MARDFLAITVGCILLACLLGIALDLVTAHVAVEYFTKYHPHVVDSDSPLVMALVWGVGASWWFGLIAGMILGITNYFLRPPMAVRRVLAAVGRTCVALWSTMMLLLIAFYLLGNLVPMDKRGEDFEFNRRIMAVALTHAGEYVLGGIAVLVVALRLRYLSKRSLRPNNGT